MPKVTISNKRGLVISKGSGYQCDEAPSFKPIRISVQSGTLTPGVNYVSSLATTHTGLCLQFPTASNFPGCTFVVQVQSGNSPNVANGFAGICLTASNAPQGSKIICLPSGTQTPGQVALGSGSNGNRFAFLPLHWNTPNAARAYYVWGQSATFLCDGINYICIASSGSYKVNNGD